MTNAPFLTRFRAFQLDSEGSLFSYYKANEYTVIEARVPKGGIEVLQHDVAACGKDRINTLHITSWGTDHCNFDDLSQILNKLRPQIIEIPAYEPESQTGKSCKKILIHYDEIHQKYIHNVRVISKEYIAGLKSGESGGTNDIVYA